MKEGGCAWTGKRSEQVKHLEGSLALHLALLHKGTQKKINSLELQLKEKEGIISRLENISLLYGKNTLTLYNPTTKQNKNLSKLTIK